MCGAQNAYEIYRSDANPEAGQQQRKTWLFAQSTSHKLLVHKLVSVPNPCSFLAVPAYQELQLLPAAPVAVH
jgi:hypothetical protein